MLQNKTIFLRIAIIKKYINTLLLYDPAVLLKDYRFSPDNGLLIALEYSENAV